MQTEGIAIIRWRYTKISRSQKPNPSYV